LPDPGKPIVSTTYPLGDFSADCSTGGVASDSGCVSTTILGSGFAATGSGMLGAIGFVSAARAGTASG